METRHLPLLVHVIHHRNSPMACRLAERVNEMLNCDSLLPGLNVPTVLPQLNDEGVLQLPDLSQAERNIVVVLADDQLNTDEDWCRTLAALASNIDDSKVYLFPIELDQGCYPLIDEFEGRSFIRAFPQNDETPADYEKRVQSLIPFRVIIAISRILNGDSISHEGDTDLRLKLFLSHTKFDLFREPRAMEKIREAFTAEFPIRAWYDSGDIEGGSEFAVEIGSGVAKSTALLCVLTENYSSREWCRREILLAKQHQRPVVVIDALQEQEVRSFPYIGNVPVIRWTGDPKAVITLVLKEHIRLQLAALNLEMWKDSVILSGGQGDDMVILQRPPELITLLEHRGKAIVYPDPPLGIEEKEILLKSGVKSITTPLESLAGQQPLHKAMIALSMSDSTDLRKYGLTKGAFERARIEVSRYALVAGAQLLYGGHIGMDSYTLPLFELVKSYCGVGKSCRILNLVGWPLVEPTVAEKSDYKRLAEFKVLPRPEGIDEGIQQRGFSAETSPLHRYAWARGMTAMREWQVRPENGVRARIVMGGKFGPPVRPLPWLEEEAKWYAGRIPGVLEEVWHSVRARQPVYLLGGFGGAGRLVVDLIRGIDRPEAAWDYQKRAPHAEAMRQIYLDRKEPWVDYPEIVADLRNAWDKNRFDNGLTIEQNETLFTSIDRMELVELILTGLGQLPAY